jgi:hypothetical protein
MAPPLTTSRFPAWSAATRWLLAGVAASLLCAWIGAAFWQQDLRWSLPTPRPAGLVAPPLGSRLELAPALARELRPGVPALLHFFNPNCPCSRFNLDHVRDLERTFGERVRVVFVVQGDDADEVASTLDDLRASAPCVLDRDGAIAHSFGVYATPQAVVLDRAGKLAYRGNYNSARFCVDPASEFARLALEDVLADRPARTFSAFATTAYGCALPADAAEAAP